MNKIVEVYELIKEFHYRFDNNEIPLISGRIYKIENGQYGNYLWSISHYCRNKQQLDIYVPSSIIFDTVEVATNQLWSYVKKFESAVEWKENPDFFR